MIESKLSEIELKDTSLPAFRFLLRYIYTGQMNLGNLKDDLIVDILGLAHQYGFQDLETAISDYLKAILNIHNVCFIYDTASLYQLDQLKSSCCLYMDRHAQEIIKHDAFNTLTAVRSKLETLQIHWGSNNNNDIINVSLVDLERNP